MYKLGKYTAHDRMSNLISDHYRILLVMSRFGIGLGFGEKSIGEICDENEVDTQTFLAVVNLILNEEEGFDPAKTTVSIESLLIYLHNSHEYFLDFRLPAIRKELVEVLGKPKTDLAKAIICYFDEYVAEVCKHMMYEEETVFPYVRSLLAGQAPKDYNMAIFRTKHNDIEARLSEFKNILIKYYPVKSTNKINSVLFDIFNCENDLTSHNALENRLLAPAVIQYERRQNRKA